MVFRKVEKVFDTKHELFLYRCVLKTRANNILSVLLFLDYKSYTASYNLLVLAVLPLYCPLE